jgi:hypothetical protein
MIDPVVCGFLVSLSLVVGFLAGSVVVSLRERGRDLDSL